MVALCPCTDKLYEAENILKIKGWKRDFCENEAENILKRKLVTKTRRNPQKA
jgi:hypothetical protein